MARSLGEFKFTSIGKKIERKIFKNLSLKIVPGEIVGLIGPSGAGKSSLLHIAGLLEKPTAGDVVIAGQRCNDLDDAARTRIRRIGIGFVYQFHHLLPEFSAVEGTLYFYRILFVLLTY